MDQQHNGSFMSLNDPGLIRVDMRLPDTMGPAERQAQRQAMKELKEVAKGPHTPEQQQKIIHILNNNPHILAAFSKQARLRASQEQWFKREQALIQQQRAIMLQLAVGTGNQALQHGSNANASPKVDVREAAFNNQCNKYTCSIVEGFEC